METNVQPNASWFVGANWDEDQTRRFLQQGIWENGYDDKYQDLVRSMQPGDRIAIKSAPTHHVHDNLPFNNRGRGVRVMYIKATGTIDANLADGKRVRVNWIEHEPYDPPRQWYFFSKTDTVWRVDPGEWRRDGLLAFTFDGQEQDINRFIGEYLAIDRDENSAVSEDVGGQVKVDQNDKSPNQDVSVEVPNFQEIFAAMKRSNI